MAFTDDELKSIEEAVGALCRSHSPAHLKDELSTDYKIIDHQVVIFERRRHWEDSSQWIEPEMAKLRYYRSRGEWHLYWMRASLKWESYAPKPSARRLSTLVNEIEKDPYGCFFG